MSLGGRLKDLGHRLGTGPVEEAATCARALTAMIGQRPPGELLPADPAAITRALLTARVIAARDPVPWPAAIMRQLDPDDPAFLPVAGLHPVMAARDRALIGLPGRERVAWVDPLGWCGVGEGPAVSVWMGLGREAWPVGRRPDELAPVELQVSQERGEGGLGLLTRCVRGPLTLLLRHWPVVLEGEVGWALQATLSLDGPAPRPARIGFCVRPASLEGTAPIFRLERDGDGLWSADGTPILALARHGDEVWTGNLAEGDPWVRFSGARVDAHPWDPGRVDLRCPAGLCSAVETFRTTLVPGEPFTRLAVLHPPPRVPAALVRTSTRSLWSSALADQKGLLAAGSEIRLAAWQPLFEATRQRLLLEPAEGNLPACLGAVALARMGFVRRAADRLARYLSRVSRDGSSPRGEAEDGAVLAWAAAELVRWTGEMGWATEQLRALERLLGRLADHEPLPGGRPLFGPDGSVAWTAIWRGAALLGGAASFRELSPASTDWALAGGRAREALPALLGPAPWAAMGGRAPDGTSAGMLTAAWLGLVPADLPEVAITVDHVHRRHWHGGGVLLHAGTHLAATALFSAVAARLGPFDAIGTVARLASSTGALPTSRHPARGALGEGDDAMAAALFALLVLDQVQAERGALRVGPCLRELRGLPTPFGPIHLSEEANGTRHLVGHWRDRPPKVELIEADPTER